MASAARLLPSIHYPFAMVSTFALFAVLRGSGLPLGISTYVPIVYAAALVTWLERRRPKREAWQPGLPEVGTDLTFMVGVQLALPPLVGFLFAALLVEPVRELNLPLTRLWPHGPPIWLQGVLMVFAVDFPRYWLHRAAHQWDVLWRLHSVHHSVERLYWLNTARFHPLEKALQMCLDSLPFVLMGVDPAVLAIYYIAYAANGFFQHCNVLLRYGVLNYVVGSAETHRWHHSREPREANRNYGNTVIVWDLVFGTWFLPEDRDVGPLGLREPDYPRSFLGLMRAPFRR